MKIPSEHKIYNIGNNNPVKLMDFVDAIEKELGITAEKEFMELQPGDVPMTYADVGRLIEDTKFEPSTSVHEGIKHFIEWYKQYYRRK